LREDLWGNEEESEEEIRDNEEGSENGPEKS